MNIETVTTSIVAGTVIKQDGKYVLVQEKQAKAYGLWNLPAGRVEVGHTIEETAIKESKEETGFDVRLIKKIDIFQHDTSVPPAHAFLAEITGGAIAFPEDEIMDVQWFSFAEICDLEKDGKTRGEWVRQAVELVE